MNRNSDYDPDTGKRKNESMNLSDDQKLHEKKETDKEEYPFLREIIKKKPVSKRKIFYGFACIIAGAVLFGGVSAVVFGITLPHVERNRVSKIELPKDKLAPTYIPTPTPTWSLEQAAENEIKSKAENETKSQIASETQSETQSEIQNEAEIYEPRPVNMQQFRDIYRQMMEVVKKPEQCMVTVKGVTSNVDWMNNEYENYSQVAGVIIAENEEEYFILTEYRAVDHVDRILVTLSDGFIIDGHFQQQDRATGMAVIKISKDEIDVASKKEVAVAELGTVGCVSRGEPVLALGSPAGYGNSVAYGMVTSVSNVKSTIDREYHVLTTDIMGNVDGSGILIDLDAHVVGVISQKFSSESNKNAVVALPITELKEMIEKLSNKEEIVYLGIQGQNIAKDLSQKTGIPEGVYIHSVLTDSPAMTAGIQNGDVIIGINEINVENLTQLGDVLDSCKIGEKMHVTGMRKGAEGYVEIVFDVTLGAL